MNEARVTRVSSAIDLDLTSVVEETAQVVVSALLPALTEVTRQVEDVERSVQALSALLTSAALSESDTVATLACHLPAGIYSARGAEITATTVARFQAERLLAAGYVLVPAHPPALVDQPAAATPTLPVLPAPEQVRNLSAREAVELTERMNQPDQHRPPSDVLTQRDEFESYISDLRQS